ncbi:TSC22 domain family protein 3 isoform X2 [Chelonia mydas]|uniref:TSC22 domain family protein 3 isoform X2 n=1 Tax=Chelonia mydas TaxID=8469 RepID=UPI001CA8538D|nr:TSC22 domain family protein 3 isoform X2 [Chelonia mydas]
MHCLQGGGGRGELPELAPGFRAGTWQSRSLAPPSRSLTPCDASRSLLYKVGALGEPPLVASPRLALVVVRSSGPCPPLALRPARRRLRQPPSALPIPSGESPLALPLCAVAMSTELYQSAMEVAVYQLHNFSISFFSSLLGGDVVSVKLDNSASGASVVAIDNKIEQAMVSTGWGHPAAHGRGRAPWADAIGLPPAPFPGIAAGRTPAFVCR